MQALKLAQLAERTGARCGQINEELAEIEQQAASEASGKAGCGNRDLAKLVAEIEAQREKTKDEKQASQEAERLLNVQRQLAQNAVREMQEVLFREKTCQNKIAEMENALRIIEENLVELKAQLEKLQAEQSGFDETALNGRLQEWLTRRGQREQVLAACRGMLWRMLRVRCGISSRNGSLPSKRCILFGSP